MLRVTLLYFFCISQGLAVNTLRTPQWIWVEYCGLACFAIDCITANNKIHLYLSHPFRSHRFLTFYWSSFVMSYCFWHSRSQFTASCFLCIFPSHTHALFDVIMRMHNRHGAVAKQGVKGDVDQNCRFGIYSRNKPPDSWHAMAMDQWATVIGHWNMRVQFTFAKEL